MPNNTPVGASTASWAIEAGSGRDFRIFDRAHTGRSVVGAFVMFLSLVYLLCAVYVEIFQHVSPQAFTGLLVAVTFLSAVVRFFLGVIW